MQITSATNSGYDYSQVSMKKKLPGTSGKESGFSEVVTKVEQEEKGERLKLSTIATAIGPNLCGITATLLESSTPENPVIQLIIGTGEKEEIYNIEINKVNPQNASEMEIFALCSYADATGKGSDDDLGSYHTLAVGATLAKYNGYTGTMIDEPPTWEEFTNVKLDWTAIGKCSVNAVKNSKDMKLLEFALLENKLLKFFADHLKKTSKNEL